MKGSLSSTDHHAQPSRPTSSANSTGQSADQQQSSRSKWQESVAKKRRETELWSRIQGRRRKNRCSNTLDGRVDEAMNQRRNRHRQDGKRCMTMWICTNTLHDGHAWASELVVHCTFSNMRWCPMESTLDERTCRTTKVD
jgi:hypothetical protein